MDILVLSDTHGRADLVEATVRRVRAGILLFLGDGLRDLNVVSDDVVVRSVRGNCDFFGADVPESRVELFGGYRIFMTHGHRYGVKYGEKDVILAAAQANADILLYGHTHRPVSRWLAAGDTVAETVLQKPLLVFCPGSLGQPPNGRPTFGMLTVRHNGVLASHTEL
ncbi:MAG: YfcE family phosphodiesterase [Ruminococcaceae bacterium]|nr:YfcE family phosphodiesterase [Oscillospiraceae bacterium]